MERVADAYESLARDIEGSVAPRARPAWLVAGDQPSYGGATFVPAISSSASGSSGVLARPCGAR
jgi:hypothetical protein